MANQSFTGQLYRRDSEDRLLRIEARQRNASTLPEVPKPSNRRCHQLSLRELHALRGVKRVS